MIHQVIFWKTSSAPRVKLRNGSAFSPTASAAAPRTMPITTSCRMLKLTELEIPASLCDVDTSSPKMLPGMIDSRKSSQLPLLEGSLAPPRSTPACRPGLVIRPMVMPITTAIRAVIANQTSVCTASLAALVTWRRLAMLTMIAVSTSGTTITRSSPTKLLPTVASTSPSQSMENWRARKPSRMPTTRPSRT
jgi:hypothetical protein